MKKFLSIILALALVISMIPAAFAAGEAELNPVYNFWKTAIAADYAATVGTDPSKVTSYEMIDTSVSSGKWFWVAGSGIRSTKALYDDQMTTSVHPNNLVANAIILKIKVDKGGIYVPDADFLSSASTGFIDMYLVHTEDYTGTLNAAGVNAAVASSSYDADATVKHAVSVDTNAASENPKNEKAPKLSLRAGDYYLFIVTTSGAKASANSNGYEYAQIKYFSLTRQPWVKLSADATEIEAESSTKITAVAENADMTAASAEISYSVSPADVASVASDGTVTGLKAGTATVTATATIGGVECSGSVEIKVTPIDKTHNFVLNMSVLKEETINAIKGCEAYDSRGFISNSALNGGVECLYGLGIVDESKETNNWALSSYGGGVVSYLFGDYTQFYVGKHRYNNAGINVGNVTCPYIDSRVVLELEIKHDGTYDITAIMKKGNPSGTEADVYIVSAAEMESKKDLMGVTVAEEDTRFNWNDVGVYKVTPAFIKTLDRLGHINGVDVAATETEQYVGTATLKKGVNYLIFNFASDNVLTSKNTQQTFNIEKLTLTEADGSAEADEAKSVTGTFSFATSLDNSIQAVVCGEEVEISAPETDENGNVFKCWTKNGVCVSTKANDTYKVMTNTYLKAVYAPAGTAEDKVVSFYKENGEYFMTVPAVDGKAVLPEEAPALPGLVFDAWYTADGTVLEAGAALTKAETIAIAKFNGRFTTTAAAKENENLSSTANIQTASAKADIVNVNGLDKSAEFNTEIVCADKKGTVTHWLRDGRVASYSPSYSYFVWDGTNIYSSYAPIEKKPLILIENRTIDGAVMIEYDKGNKAIAEVGIIFGTASGITINSCNSKASSQWNKAHGQFSATPLSDETYARGYLIYADGDDYKVIYTDAIELQ